MEIFTKKNWFIILTCYSSYNPILQNEAITYFRRHYKSLTAGTLYTPIPFYVMKIVLENDSEIDCHEECICDSLLKWFEYNDVIPEQGIHLILETVQIQLLSISYIGTKLALYAGHLPNFYLMIIIHLQFTLIRRILNVPKLSDTGHFVKDRLLLVHDSGKEGSASVEILNFTDKSRKFINLKVDITCYGCGIVGQHIFFIGGERDGRTVNDVQALNLFSGITETMTSLRVSRSAMGVAMLKEDTHGAIYAIGGWKLNKNEKFPLNSVEKWSTKVRRWTPVTSMYHKRACITATAFNGKIYVAGGYGTDPRGLEEYDPRFNIWTPLADMHDIRRFCSITTHKGMIYAIGGSANKVAEVIRSVERYDIRTKEWSYVTSLPQPLRGYSCSVGNRLIFVPIDTVKSCILEYVDGNRSWKQLSDVMNQNNCVALMAFACDLEGNAFSHRGDVRK